LKVLVTGGAGYIGSHVVKALHEAGHQTLVYDNLCRGHRGAVARGALFEGDIRDRKRLRQALTTFQPDAAIHLAALAIVSESVTQPDLYASNNMDGSRVLVEELVEAGVDRLVFSSSAAVYGVPDRVPIPEESALRPLNPYGETKVATERLLAETCLTHGLKAVSLRYFNACGADPEGELGEHHEPETHLIPLALRAATGQGAVLTVCGTDYPTPDGTCIRDYIHVADIARAHVAALSTLGARERPEHSVYNLGTEKGHSVLEVLRAIEVVTGSPVPHTLGCRRAGDPPVLVAAAGKARRELGWTPAFSDLETIARTAWQWFQAHPHGYAPDGGADKL